MTAREQRYIDRYADGSHISHQRRQKAEFLAETLERLFPGEEELEIVDFGCADGAVPVLILHALGAKIRRITGITLLDYNDLADKPAHAHPRFQRLVHDLQQPLDNPALPWEQCDAVLATAFFHYFAQPEVPLATAFRLLRPGGCLLAGMPARWVLWLRQHGFPGLLPRNRRIRSIYSLAEWRRLAEACGFVDKSRQAFQWLGIPQADALERRLRRSRLLSRWGSNYLVVYRKPG